MPIFIDVFHGFYWTPIVLTFIDIVPFLINIVPTNNLFLKNIFNDLLFVIVQNWLKMAQYQWKLAQLEFGKIREKRQWKMAQFKWNLAQLQWNLAQYILFNKWRRINKIGIFWNCWLLQKTVDCKIHIVDGDHSPFFFKGVNNNDIDSSKRLDFAPKAQQCPGERQVRPDQFLCFETIY